MPGPGWPTNGLCGHSRPSCHVAIERAEVRLTRCGGVEIALVALFRVAPGRDSSLTTGFSFQICPSREQPVGARLSRVGDGELADLSSHPCDRCLTTPPDERDRRL
jgi:hypothetical protein